MSDHKDTFLFLMTCSRRSLGDFLLARLSKHSQLKRDLLLRLEDMVEQIIENRAEIYIANLFRDHGEEILERLAPRATPHRILSPLKAAKKA